MKRFGLVACSAVLVASVGCGGGSSGSGSSSSASKAAPASTGTSTGTPATRGSTTVSTGQSTTGTLKITVSPASAAVGAPVSIQMSGVAAGAAGVGMGLLDSTGAQVAVPTQSLNKNNSSELDFTVPQTANGAYSVVVQIVDANNKVLDQCMAPFAVGATGRGTTPSTAAGATVTATSKTGTLTISATPGAAAANAPVVIMCTNLDAGTAGFNVQLVDPSGAATQVTGSLNQQTSTATSVELDVVVPTVAAGVYVLDVQASDANSAPLDDVQVSFTVNAGGATPPANTATVPSVTGVNMMNPAGTLAFTCAPGGGSTGNTCTVTLTGVPAGTNNVFMCLFDQNNTEVDFTTMTAVSATTITFQIPTTAAGVYYLDAFALDGPASSQTSNVLDNAESSFTVNGAAGSNTGTPPSTTGVQGGASTTLAGTLVIESIGASSGHVGATVAITVGGLTSNNVGLALIDPTSPSAAPIYITTASVNQANSNTTTVEIDAVIPQAAPLAYVIMIVDMGPNYTAANAATAQPVGEAAIPFTVN